MRMRGRCWCQRAFDGEREGDVFEGVRAGGGGDRFKAGDAAYAEGRSAAWLKSKCLHEQEFVIGGYTLPGKGKAGGPGIGALLLGYYDDSKRLIYAGRTGTGFTQKICGHAADEIGVCGGECFAVCEPFGGGAEGGDLGEAVDGSAGAVCDVDGG